MAILRTVMAVISEYWPKQLAAFLPTELRFLTMASAKRVSS
jgi:hypothetical protein